jgi:hypothetical protein
MSLLDRKAGAAAVDPDDFNAIVDAVVALQNGGSQPLNTLGRTIVTFEETAGAGTYMATIPVPANTAIWGLLAIAVADFDADTVYLTVSDVLSGAGSYFDDLPWKDPEVYTLTPIDPFNPGDAGNSYESEDNAGNTYMSAMAFPFENHHMNPGFIYFAEDTITVELVTTGVGGATGRGQVWLIGFGVPAETIVAVKA